MLAQYKWLSYRDNAEGRLNALIAPHEHYRRRFTALVFQLKVTAANILNPANVPKASVSTAAIPRWSGESGEKNVAMRPASAMGKPAIHKSLTACGPPRSMTACTCPMARVTGPIKALLCFISGALPAAAACTA
jgi:hypothetical protein